MINGRRHELVLATKFGIRCDPKTGRPAGVDGSPANVRAAIDGSLARLAALSSIDDLAAGDFRREQLEANLARVGRVTTRAHSIGCPLDAVPSPLSEAGDGWWE